MTAISAVELAMGNIVGKGVGASRKVECPWNVPFFGPAC
jgi:hypothetical protein